MLLAKTVFAAAVLSVALIGAGTAQEIDFPRGDDYTQAASGMVFPAVVGEFGRGRIRQYSNGDDMSAGYGRIAPGAEIVATVYVYPSLQITSIGSQREVIEAARATMCEGQFDALQAEIAQAYTNEALVSEAPIQIMQGGSARAGLGAVYTLRADFMSRQNEELRSEAYLFCYVGGRWSVKYRFSFPSNYDASADIAAFMRDWTWTIPAEAF